MTHQADSTPAARCLGGAGVCSRWALECGMRPDGYPRLEPVHSIASSKSPTWLFFSSNPSLTVETFYAISTLVIFVTIPFLALLPLSALHP